MTLGFSKASKSFSGPESRSKISNLTIAELFYSRILNMNRSYLHTKNFRRIQLSVFSYGWTKFSLRAWKVSRAFEKWGPGYSQAGVHSTSVEIVAVVNIYLVYTKTVDSVEGARWLVRQTPNILCYLPLSNLREYGVPVCICDKWRYHPK